MTTNETQFPKATPQLRDLLDRFGSQVSRNLNCHIIGRIEKFDKTKNTIEASCGLKRQYSDGTIVEFPKFIDVPVLTLTGGDSFLTLPIKAGDWCLLLFCDRDIDSWWYSGEVREPNSPRHHSLSDAVALVGLRPATEALPLLDDQAILNGGTSGVGIKNNYGQVTIDTAGKTTIANQAASLKTILDNLLTALSTLAVDPGSHVILPTTSTAILQAKTQLALLMNA